MKELIDKHDVLSAIAIMRCGSPEINAVLDKVIEKVRSIRPVTKQE